MGKSAFEQMLDWFMNVERFGAGGYTMTIMIEWHDFQFVKGVCYAMLHFI